MCRDALEDMGGVGWVVMWGRWVTWGGGWCGVGGVKLHDKHWGICVGMCGKAWVGWVCGWVMWGGGWCEVT